MRPAIDLVGRTFGRLRVVSRAGRNERRYVTWNCACDCGNAAVVSGNNLVKSFTMSCGCLVGLVANSRPAKRYDGLTMVEHVERSGIPKSTLQMRIAKFGEPFPPHLEKNRAEQELRVFEQDRENNRRSRDTRMGAAAAWHRAPSKKAATQPERPP